MIQSLSRSVFQQKHVLRLKRPVGESFWDLAVILERIPMVPQFCCWRFQSEHNRFFLECTVSLHVWTCTSVESPGSCFQLKWFVVPKVNPPSHMHTHTCTHTHTNSHVLAHYPSSKWRLEAEHSWARCQSSGKPSELQPAVLGLSQLQNGHPGAFSSCRCSTAGVISLFSMWPLSKQQICWLTLFFI